MENIFPDNSHEDNHDQADRTNIIDQMVQHRIAWSFSGRTIFGTKLPDGTTYRGSGFSQGGAGNTPEEEIYYHSTTNPKTPNEIIGYCIGIPYGIGRISDEEAEAFGILVSTIPSKYAGFHEIIIQGISGCLDDRSLYISYTVCQRILSKPVLDFVNKVKQEPDLVEVFFQQSLPGFQSSTEKCDGLYRIKTDHLYMADEEVVRKFSQKYPLIEDSKGSLSVPTLFKDRAMELRFMSNNLKFSRPVGSGTSQDFIPLKNTLIANPQLQYKQI